MRVTRIEFERHWPAVMGLVALHTAGTDDAGGGVGMIIFSDRAGAGRQLAERLLEYAERDVVVLGLTLGGVPLAFEVARELGAQLDILVVRKLAVPGEDQVSIGAIASGGMIVVNDRWVTRIPTGALESMIDTARKELSQRERALRGDHPAIDVHGKVVIVVDDGIATGATMRAAIRALHQRGPKTIVVAVPVASKEGLRSVDSEADKLICLCTPEDFRAVGLWYVDFEPVTEQNVRDLLARAHHQLAVMA